MKDEIKEILELLEKYGQLTPDAIDDLHYIKDYITNLQEENKEADEAVKYWQEQYDNSQQRIDKAIKYINKNEDYFNNYSLVNRNELLNILIGEDKE